MSDDNEKGSNESASSSIPLNLHLGSGVGSNGMPNNPVAQTNIPVIKEPTEREKAVFSDQRVTTCGSCKHFKYALAQKDFEKSKWEWLKSLTDPKQYGWKAKHLPDHPRRLAICGQKDDTLVSAYSKSCEFYKNYRS